MRSAQKTLVAILSAATCLILAVDSPRAAPRRQAENIIVVTLDGVRWQEVFRGAERDLVEGKDGGAADPKALAQRFVRPTAEASREAIMPFFWTTVAGGGQVFGDPARGSVAHVTNGLWFSYPGYSELLAGVADPRVDSNKKVPNPNVTVLEWLNGRPAWHGRVAAVGSWDVLPFIVNVDRSHLRVISDGTPFPKPENVTQRVINEVAADVPANWAGAWLDVVSMQSAAEYLRTFRPRVLYVMLGETDEWAHERRYDLYLDAIYRGDQFIRRLWETVQSMPDYRGKTALIVATDHGRGATATDWTDHGQKVPAAERTWIAVMGPDTPALGSREGMTVSAAQIAATIADLVGEEFLTAQPKAAPPLPLR